jgi:hypothetical protein
VIGALKRKHSVHAAEAKAARAATSGKVKFTLPGPMTIVDTIADRFYGDRVKMAMAFAKLLNEEARELEAIGIDTVQFDEPAFNVFTDEVLDWGIPALLRAAEGLKCTTAVHVCYGYGIQANIDWKKTLGDEWRQYERIFPALAKSRIGQVSLEVASPADGVLESIAAADGETVVPGALLGTVTAGAVASAAAPKAAAALRTRLRTAAHAGPQAFTELLQHLRSRVRVLSSDPTSGLCYVRHPTDCLGLLCDARALLPLRMHEAACRLTRVARARLRQRQCKQRIACLALQAACRLFFALRRARLRRAQLNAQVSLVDCLLSASDCLGASYSLAPVSHTVP